MKCILLPIKPEYVEHIRLGNKIFEYRRVVPKNRNINKLLIYSSHPVKKIVAICCIEEILCKAPEFIWKETSVYSGISKCIFDNYFMGYKIAYAIKLTGISFFHEPFTLSDIGLSSAPQSFQYIEVPSEILIK